MPKLSFSYIFDEEIERVFQAFIHVSASLRISFRNSLSELIFFEGKSFADENCQFSFKWKNYYTFKMISEKIIKTKFFKSFTHSSISIDKVPMQIKITFEFYWDSINENTIFILDLDYQDEFFTDLIKADFSEEDKLASDLVKLHKDFYYTLNMLNIPYLIKKRSNIQLKLDSYNNIHQLNEAQEIEIKNMAIFLEETSKLLAEEKKVLNEKANRLYNKWLEIKDKRRAQGYKGTTVKLNVIRFQDHGMDANAYDYAFILTNEKEDDEIPKEERTRREKISNNSVFLKVYINGVFAFETRPVALTYPNYEVEINSQFIMNLYTRPTKFEIELYINKNLEKKFEAEPPGMFSKTVTSSSVLYEEIQFGKKEEPEKEEKEKKNIIQKDENKETKIENKNEEEDKNLLNEKMDNKKGNIISDNESIEGCILLKTEWEGRAPDLPPTKIEDKLELVNKQIEFKELIKKPFAFDYPFDVNDPRNVASVEDMKKDKLELMLKFLYKEYLLTYYDVYSKRHELLLKRLTKKSIGKLKFPILESQ